MHHREDTALVCPSKRQIRASFLLRVVDDDLLYERKVRTCDAAAKVADSWFDSGCPRRVRAVRPDATPTDEANRQQ